MVKLLIAFLVLFSLAHSSSRTGSGFFVNGKYLLTNYHVVKGCDQISIHQEGFRNNATIFAIDPSTDLAILKSSPPHPSVLKFSKKKIRLGEKVIVLGYPFGELLGSGLKVTTGNISSLTGLINDSTQIQITSPVQPGNSGGPLLDESGNVIGVIVARLTPELQAQNVNLAIKKNIVTAFLNAHGIHYETSESNSKMYLPDLVDASSKSIVQVSCHLRGTSKSIKPTPKKDTSFDNSAIRDYEVRNVLNKYVKKGNTKDIAGMIDLYADYVDYFNDGYLSKNEILQDKLKYYSKWPYAHFEVKRVNFIDNAPGKPRDKIIQYTISFNVYNRTLKKGIKGEAKNTMILRKVGGNVKIISDKQKVLWRTKY